MNVFSEVITLVLTHTLWELGLLCFKLCVATFIIGVSILLIMGTIGITMKLGQILFARLDGVDKRKKLVYDSKREDTPPAALRF